MKGTILLLGTWDTKGEELAWARKLIQERGHDVFTIDAGVLSEPPLAVDVDADTVARAGGGSLADLRDERDRALPWPSCHAALRPWCPNYSGRGASTEC